MKSRGASSTRSPGEPQYEEPRRHLTQMRIEPVIATFIIPARRHLAGCIAEHKAELMFYPNGVAKLPFDCIQASLRGVCPDTQDIREICNPDHAHPVFPLFPSSPQRRTRPAYLVYTLFSFIPI